MANPSTVDAAGRAIAGLLTYNPGPGIYSRLERAVEAMPENVRVQELPGLIKRYKDGVPGWELKAVDLDSLVAGRDVVPRSEILAAVKERSPVYTHREVVLSEAGPHMRWEGDNSFNEPGAVPRDQMPEPARIGMTADPHGQPVYPEYGQDGDNYTEVLLTQPVAQELGDYGNHWGNARAVGAGDAVAHARFDTHGDALRINELQSDLGIHNRKQREQYAEYQRMMREHGREPGPIEFQSDQPLPFPLEDAWADILIKRLALEAARKGHRAIEVASPRAIADKVGGNIDNYEHFYGKVVPGAIERLGRKMGGVVDVTPSPQGLLPGYTALAQQAMVYNEPYASGIELLKGIRSPGPRPAFEITPEQAFRKLTDQDTDWGRYDQGFLLHDALAEELARGGMAAGEARIAAAQHMPALMRMAEDQAAAYDRFASLRDLGFVQDSARRQSGSANPPPRRYLMSDEMRRRILQEGIPAAVAIGIGTDQVLDRLNGQSPQPQMR